MVTCAFQRELIMNNTLPESTDFDPAAHTLLIIDDNPANLEIATDYLIEYGFRVLVAQSGEVGLERARWRRGGGLRRIQ